MRLLPQSPRKRRRLLWTAPFAVLLVAVVVNLVFFRNLGAPENNHFTNRPPVVIHAPKAVKASAGERRAALAVLDAFMRSAVLRVDLASSWPLASAKMRVGVSHADWLHGDIPVVPYPRAAFRGLSPRLTGSYAGELDYDVIVLPKTLRGEQRVYAVVLSEHHGRWFVDSCYPRASL